MPAAAAQKCAAGDAHRQPEALDAEERLHTPLGRVVAVARRHAPVKIKAAVDIEQHACRREGKCT